MASVVRATRTVCTCTLTEILMMVRSAGGWLVVLLACLASGLLQTTTVRVSAQEIAIAVIVEEEQTDVPATVAAVLRRVEQSERTGVRFREHFVHVNREEESSAHGVSKYRFNCLMRNVAEQIGI